MRALAAAFLLAGSAAASVALPQRSEMAAVAAHHPECGAPTGHEHWAGNTVRLSFAHCTITGRYVVAQNRTATPPPPPTVPTATATTQPTITAVPTATSTAVPSTHEAYLVSLMNQSRASFGVAPLAENLTQDGCSRAHSVHMAAVGTISHDQFPADVCIGWSTVGENVGQAGGGDVDAQLLQLHQLMMSEGVPFVGCSGSHACNVVNPAFRQVGVGIFVDNAGRLWLTEDFTN